MSEANTKNTQPEFRMEKIYVKDLSLEIPNAPKVFLERENPKIDVHLHTQSETVEEDVHEVVVMTTVTAKVGEKVMFLIEAKQAGIFRMSNMAAEHLEQVLAVMCPNILFPYLREVVSDVAIRGGFAPVLLNPINFEMIYQQQKQQMNAATSETAH